MSWFDQQLAIKSLAAFFRDEGGNASDFGKRVYQTFKALTFAQTIKWYKDRNWNVVIVNPGKGPKGEFRLKYSTRGDAKNFTYARCTNGNNPSDVVQVRHQIRVETAYNDRKQVSSLRANLVCDVAVLSDRNYDYIVGNMHVANECLVTFAEAKHMDAYAELVAAFIGLVHELQPWRLARDIKKKRALYSLHPKPWLNLSGICMATAEGIKHTISRRGLDIEVHDSRSPLNKI